jgi:elongation factor Ts
MAEITASLVKELRERTGAGMMDCKKALTATDGDPEAAADWLRTKGLAAAAKRSGKVAAEGLVGIASGAQSAAIVEINSETDFVARNDSFQAFVKEVAGLALESAGDVDALAGASYPGAARTVAEETTNLTATIGEHISVRRAQAISVEKGVVATYIHGALSPGVGRIGVAVALESEGDPAKLTEFGKQVAMHVAATGPKALSPEDLNADEIARERAVLAEQARESGKPDNIIEKMVEGRLRKFYEEVVLLEQTFVIDNETKVTDAVDAAAAEIGSSVRISGFIRFAVGEGIEKQESNFAAEVAAQTGG